MNKSTKNFFVNFITIFLILGLLYAKNPISNYAYGSNKVSFPNIIKSAKKFLNEKKSEVNNKINSIKNSSLEKIYISLNYKNLGSKKFLLIYKHKYFKYTKNQSNFIYFGKLKNNKPTGTGVLFVKSKNNIFILRYIGEFKNGNFDGYGSSYVPIASLFKSNSNESFDNNLIDLSSELAVFKFHEGNYSKGKMNGKGKVYSIIFSKNFSDSTDSLTLLKYVKENLIELTRLSKNKSKIEISNLSIYKSTYLLYSGNFKNNKKSTGTVYDKDGNVIKEFN